MICGSPIGKFYRVMRKQTIFLQHIPNLLATKFFFLLENDLLILENNSSENLNQLYTDKDIDQVLVYIIVRPVSQTID